MSTFGKSFSRELGKNTGKFVSNKVFGTSGWATPRRHIIDIEDKRRAVEERKAEREQNRAEREAEREARREAAEERRRQREIEKQEYQEGVELRRLQREIARQEKEEEREHKAWLKEQERISKEEEKQSNFDEYENFESYLESIQSLHEVSIEKIDWESLIENKTLKDILTENYESEILTEDDDDEYEDDEDEDDQDDENNGIDIEFYYNLIGKESCLAALYGKLENGNLGAELNEVPKERPNHELDFHIKSLSEKMNNCFDHKTKLSHKYFNKTDDDYTKKYNKLLNKFESIKKELNSNKRELNSNEKKIPTYKAELTKLESKNKIIAFLSNASKQIEETKQEIEYLSDRIKLLNKEIPIAEKELIEIEPKLVMMEEIKNLESSIDKIKCDIDRINDLGIFLDTVWKKSYAIYVENNLETNIIQNILSKNPDYYRKISEYRPFDNFLKEYGSTASYNYYEDIIDVELFINIEDVVPINKTTVTASGVLSSKPFSDSERNKIIKNYVSSLTLRLVEEMFAVFPVNEIIISVIHNERSSKTGNFEDVAILSSSISRNILETLNLDYVNPSEALSNFKTNIKYSNSNGLQNIEKISVPLSKKQKTKTIKKELEKKSVVAKNDELSTNQLLTIEPNKTVSDLKHLVKEIFDIDIELKTKAGSIAGDNRKIKALASKAFKKFEVKNIKDIAAETGIQIEVTEHKNNKNEISAKKNKSNEPSIKIEINKTMNVKDVIYQFEKHFGKTVFILSDKGNKVSENRRIQALTKVKIDQEFFTFDKLTKANLKIIKKEIGLHIDY